MNWLSRACRRLLDPHWDIYEAAYPAPPEKCGAECLNEQINRRYLGPLTCGLEPGHGGVHEGQFNGERWFGGLAFPPNPRMIRNRT